MSGGGDATIGRTRFYARNWFYQVLLGFTRTGLVGFSLRRWSGLGFPDEFAGRHAPFAYPCRLDMAVPNDFFQRRWPQPIPSRGEAEEKTVQIAKFSMKAGGRIRPQPFD